MIGGVEVDRGNHLESPSILQGCEDQRQYRWLGYVLDETSQM